MPRQAHYYLELYTGGKTYKSHALTIDDALLNMGLSWEQIKLKGILNIKYKDKKLEKRFGVAQLRRIFSNKIIRAKQVANLDYLMR